MSREQPRVLIVEDQIGEILLVKTVLEDLGCKVEIGIDGMGAVENLVKNQYDLLVLDWMMPDFNGNQALEYAERLIEKEHTSFKTMPFVAYTGLEESQLNIPELKHFKFLAHWKKPFMELDLETQVKKVLDEVGESK